MRPAAAAPAPSLALGDRLLLALDAAVASAAPALRRRLQAGLERGLLGLAQLGELREERAPVPLGGRQPTTTRPLGLAPAAPVAADGPHWPRTRVTGAPCARERRPQARTRAVAPASAAGACAAAGAAALRGGGARRRASPRGRARRPQRRALRRPERRRAGAGLGGRRLAAGVGGRGGLGGGAAPHRQPGRRLSGVASAAGASDTGVSVTSTGVSAAGVAGGAGALSAASARGRRRRWRGVTRGGAGSEDSAAAGASGRKPGSAARRTASGRRPAPRSAGRRPLRVGGGRRPGVTRRRGRIAVARAGASAATAASAVASSCAHGRGRIAVPLRGRGRRPGVVARLGLVILGGGRLGHGDGPLAAGWRAAFRAGRELRARARRPGATKAPGSRAASIAAATAAD